MGQGTSRSSDVPNPSPNPSLPPPAPEGEDVDGKSADPNTNVDAQLAARTTNQPAADGPSDNAAAERTKAASSARSTPPSSPAPSVAKHTAAGSTGGAPRSAAGGTTSTTTPPAMNGPSNNTVAERPKAASPARSPPPSRPAPAVGKRTAVDSTGGALRPATGGTTAQSALRSIVSRMRCGVSALWEELSSALLDLPALDRQVVVLLSPSGQRLGLRGGMCGSVIAARARSDEAEDKFAMCFRGGNRVALCWLGNFCGPSVVMLPGGQLALEMPIFPRHWQEYEVIKMGAGTVVLLRAWNGSYLWAVHWGAYRAAGCPTVL